MDEVEGALHMIANESRGIVLQLHSPGMFPRHYEVEIRVGREGFS